MENINEIKKKNKAKNLIAFAALTMMLVVFPAVSWYYLNRGLNYQKEARAELGDHGKVGDFRFLANVDSSFAKADMAGKFSVATFINVDNELLAVQYLSLLNRLHEQFDKRPDVLFLTYVDSEKILGYNLLEKVAEQADLQDAGQAIFLTGPSVALERQATQGYRLPLNDGAFAQNTQMALVDTVGTILRYYNFQDEAQVRRLVEHLAMVIPKDIPEDAEKVMNEEL